MITAGQEQVALLRSSNRSKAFGSNPKGFE